MSSVDCLRIQVEVYTKEDVVLMALFSMSLILVYSSTVLKGATPKVLATVKKRQHDIGIGNNMNIVHIIHTVRT